MPPSLQKDPFLMSPDDIVLCKQNTVTWSAQTVCWDKNAALASATGNQGPQSVADKQRNGFFGVYAAGCDHQAKTPVGIESLGPNVDFLRRAQTFASDCLFIIFTPALMMSGLLERWLTLKRACWKNWPLQMCNSFIFSHCLAGKQRVTGLSGGANRRYHSNLGKTTLT